MQECKEEVTEVVFLEKNGRKSTMCPLNDTDVLGPVVQRVVSLKSLLRVISLTVLAGSIYNILIFFAEKM